MIKISPYRMDGLESLELVTGALRLVAVREFGPRIAAFGKPEGENLLLWEPGKYTRGDWDLRGGHRVWITRPGADECEDTYAVDNAPCEIDLLDDGFRLTGAENPTNRTCRGIQVRVLSDRALEVDSFLINTGNMLYSGGVWALTCTVPARGTRYAIPVGENHDWDTCRMVMYRRWAGHGQGGYADSQFTFSDDLFHIDPRGLENKRMVESHLGIIAMSDPARQVTFGKRVDYTPGANYPMGCNIAVYIGPDNFMVEMESMSPEQTLKPGQSMHHIETWVLRDGAVPLRDAEAVQKLFVRE